MPGDFLFLRPFSIDFISPGLAFIGEINVGLFVLVY